MAIPLLTRLRRQACRVEGTYGTVETSPVAGDAAFRCENPQLKVRGPTLRRERANGLGSDAGVAETFSTEFTGRLRMHGAATVPNWAAWLLPSCGMALTSRTYSNSADQTAWKGVTAWNYKAGRQTIGRGLMGNLVITLAAGRTGVIDWSHVGGWVANPAAVAMLGEPTLEANSALPPIWDGTGSLTLDGSTDFKVGNMTIDLGNQVSLREDENSDGGYIGGYIGDRLGTVTMDPEAMDLATQNWFAEHAAQSEVLMTVVLNGGTNNTITITVSNMQLANPPDDDGDRGGRLVDALEFHINEDALSIAFS